MFAWKHCAGCKKPSDKTFCIDCEASVAPAPPGPFWAAWKYSGAVANAIIAWKERHVVGAGDTLVAGAAQCLPPLRIDVVVCVPPAFWRTLWRGFHPPDAWGKAAAQKLGADFAPRALKRLDDKRQMGRNRGQRARRLFALRDGDALCGKTILLVDDVTTSGATFRDAARALGEARPEKIYFAALAAVR